MYEIVTGKILDGNDFSRCKRCGNIYCHLNNWTGQCLPCRFEHGDPPADRRDAVPTSLLSCCGGVGCGMCAGDSEDGRP